MFFFFLLTKRSYPTRWKTRTEEGEEEWPLRFGHNRLHDGSRGRGPLLRMFSLGKHAVEQASENDTQLLALSLDTYTRFNLLIVKGAEKAA